MRRTLLIAAFALVLGAAVTLLAGCGSSAVSASDAPSASEQAQARVFAGVVNLRAPDLPGFKVVSAALSEHGAPPGPLSRRVEECDRGPVLNTVASGVASPLLQTQNVPIQTLVSAVFPVSGASVASAYITAADSRRGLRCLQREEIRRSHPLPGGRRMIEVLALRALGRASVSGIRVWRCLPGPQACKSRRVRSFKDLLWFAAGPYVVTLVYIAGARNEAKGPEPLALPLERHLIALLYSRARAHKA